MYFKKEKKIKALTTNVQLSRTATVWQISLQAYALFLCWWVFRKVWRRGREGGRETDGWKVPLGYSPSYAFSGFVRHSPGFLSGANGKEPACQCMKFKRCSLIPGSGRSPGGGHGNPLQYSCLENPTDREAWRATVHGVPKSRTRLSDLANRQPPM